MLNRLYRKRVGAERMLLIFLAPQLTVSVGYTSISTHTSMRTQDTYKRGCGQIYSSTCPEHVADVYCGGAFSVVGIRPETQGASVRI